MKYESKIFEVISLYEFSNEFRCNKYSVRYHKKRLPKIKDGKYKATLVPSNKGNLYLEVGLYSGFVIFGWNKRGFECMCQSGFIELFGQELFDKIKKERITFQLKIEEVK